MLVVEDFVPEFYQNCILRSVLDSSTHWTAIDGVAGTSTNVSTPGVSMSEDQSAFFHLVFGSGQPYSPLFHLLKPMIDALEYGLQTPVLDLDRIRIGMTMQSRFPGHHAPHVDFYEEHRSLLYYVNDSDGDTVFYNERYDGDKNISNFTVEKSVTPKKGRAVIFDGDHYHSSGIPFDSKKRLVININFRT